MPEHPIWHIAALFAVLAVIAPLVLGVSEVVVYGMAAYASLRGESVPNVIAE